MSDLLCLAPRTRPGSHRGWIGRLSACAVLVSALAVAASAFGAGIHGRVAKAPGTLDLRGVACPPSGACVAVGETPRDKQNFSHGVVVALSHGKPGKAIRVPGTFSLDQIACPRKDFCIAVGQGTGAGGVIVKISHGKPGKARSLSIFADGIGCGSTSSCWVTGTNLKATAAQVVHIVNGSVAKVFSLKGTSPFLFGATEQGGAAPACLSASSCTLAGHTGQSGPGLVMSLANGKVKVTHMIPQATALSGIACTSRTFCTVVGFNQMDGLVLSINHGRLGKVRRPSKVDFLGPLACRAADKCYAFGDKLGTTSVVVPINRGTPGSVQAIKPRIYDAFCAGKTCFAVGEEGGFPNGEGVVFTFS